MRIGIIGYGTIGKDVAQAVIDGRAGKCSLVGVLVRRIGHAEAEPAAVRGVMTDAEEAFFASEPDVIVECAGHAAVRQYGERALEGGANLVVVSVGAFADEDLYRRVIRRAEASGKQVIVPSAAIGGLDRIAAGAVGTLDDVTLMTRKPPQAWYGTRIEREVDLAVLTEPYCAFDGAARDAARLFPESVNVSAALSLAGVGFDRTRVKVYADPGVSYNTHEITASGTFGRIELCIRNTPSANNPKTGYIVAMSVIKCLRNLSFPFVIGV